MFCSLTSRQGSSARSGVHAHWRCLAQEADQEATDLRVSAAHESTMTAVKRLRETLLSEHSFAFQASYLRCAIC